MNFISLYNFEIFCLLWNNDDWRTPRYRSITYRTSWSIFKRRVLTQWSIDVIRVYVSILLKGCSCCIGTYRRNVFRSEIAVLLNQLMSLIWAQSMSPYVIIYPLQTCNIINPSIPYLKFSVQIKNLERWDGKWHDIT